MTQEIWILAKDKGSSDKVLSIGSLQEVVAHCRQCLIPSEQSKAPTVTEVEQKGYWYHDRLSIVKHPDFT